MESLLNTFTLLTVVLVFAVLIGVFLTIAFYNFSKGRYIPTIIALIISIWLIIALGGFGALVF